MQPNALTATATPAPCDAWENDGSKYSGACGKTECLIMSPSTLKASKFMARLWPNSSTPNPPRLVNNFYEKAHCNTENISAAFHTFTASPSDEFRHTRFRFGAWSLELLWMLDVGVWMFLLTRS